MKKKKYFFFSYYKMSKKINSDSLHETKVAGGEGREGDNKNCYIENGLSIFSSSRLHPGNSSYSRFFLVLSSSRLHS